MQVKIEESWRSQLQEEFDKPYFARLAAFVREEYRTQRVCPVNGDLFRVFNLCPFDRVRVVILGQDPYPDPRFYYGICFSVPDGVPIPGSLQNIFREVHDDTGRPVPASGRLERWVAQGVLSMNTIFTTRAFRSRRRDPPPQRAARPPSFPALGRSRAAEGGADRSRTPSRAHGGAPLAPVGRPGVLRLPPFQPRQRLPARARHPRNRMVIR